MNLVTGTVALPGGVADGLTYDVTLGRRPRRSPRTQLRDADDHAGRPHRGARAAPAAGAQPGRRPRRGPRRRAGTRWRRSATSSSTRGFYDAHRRHRRPATPTAASPRCSRTPTRIVGFEEQYAAAAAVMAQVAEPAGARRRRLRDPRRRLAATGAAEVTANDISAWVELDAGELGWVPVDVTPDRSRDARPRERRARRPSRSPSPTRRRPRRRRRTSSRRASEDDEVDDDDDASRSRHEFGDGTRPGAVGGRRRRRRRRADRAAACCSPLVVVGWKALRRRRRRRRGRRPTGRIAGAWAEAIDRCTEAGAPRADRRRRRTSASASTSHDQRARRRRAATCARSPARSTGPPYAARAAERRARRRGLARQRRGRRRAAPRAAAPGDGCGCTSIPARCARDHATQRRPAARWHR